jgi:hypothetical protein
MYSHQLNKLGKQHVYGFIGTFALDKLPKHIGSPPKSLIVNTDTQNLPGRHWIAVSYECGGIAYAFDPLGFYYPAALISYLHRNPYQKVHYNYIMYQKPWEHNCGQHCISFLQSRTLGYKHN